MAENKVQFGLKNVHYAVLTEGTTNSWATPVAVKGAVNLSLDANGDSTDFYADNVTYYRTVANNGYTGTLELAKVTDAMLADIWGISTTTASGVQYEYNSVEPKAFALMFEIAGDQNEEQYLFYRCLAGRPPISSGTTTETKEPVTQEIEISCLPLVTGTTNQIGLIKAKAGASATTAAKTAWYTSVNVPA